MSFYSTHYLSGEEIRAGDRVRWGSDIGRVVFVMGDEQWPAEWNGSKDWFREEYGEGFMLEVEGTGPVFMTESDEDLELVGRGGEGVA